MGRLRIRDRKNNDWLDICQSEWYIRNTANTGWERITPSRGLKVRHGTDNYWVNIDCMSEEPCGPDPYGGTEDGKGENGSGSGTNAPPDVGYPGETDGKGTPGFNPWDPDTYKPSDPLLPPSNNGGNNGPGNPDYNDPDANESEEGEGDDNCAQGRYANGSYPPGYDLPDGCGPGGGLNTDDNGEPVIVRPGTDTKESYDDQNGEGTSEEEGSEEDAYTCPTTVSSRGKQVTEFYVELGTTAGQVDLEYNVFKGLCKFVAYIAGKRVATTEGAKSGTGRLSFQYDPATTNGDTKVFIRARVAGDEGRWNLRVPCPGAKEEIGTITEPAPCLGTFENKAGGGRVTEVVHEMGVNTGTVVLEYQAWNIGDTFSVYYGNTKLAGTTGPVTGTGKLTFTFTPVDGDTTITVRITSTTDDTTWAYLINCPGTDGTSDDPKACDPDTPTSSGGAGVTDLFFDLGADPGQASVRFQAWNIPDTFEVFQGQTLLGSSGNVTGEGILPFQYNPAAGDVRVRVTGNGQTTWAFIMNCPEDPLVNLSCGQLHESASAGQTVVALTGANGSFSLVEYLTVDGNGTEAANTVTITYDGAEIENTGPVLRSRTKGIGTLVIPTKNGVNSVAVNSASPVNWWGHVTYCPLPYAPVFGMTKFTDGVPHVFEGGGGNVGAGYAKKISTFASMSPSGRVCQILMTMFNSAGGVNTFDVFADDYAFIYVMKAGTSNLIEVGAATFPTAATHTATLDSGPYYLFAILEEENPAASSNDTCLGLKITSPNGTVNCVSSKDWYGCLFEQGTNYNGNTPIIGTAQALVYDDDAAANAYMFTNAAPTPELIFNTWRRFDGANYYADRTDAETNAPGQGAATWQYNSGTQSFEQQSNVSSPNGIVSYTTYSSYTFEATIQSNNVDDDANGLIVAYVRDGSVNKSLVIGRSGGGIAPNSGFGILYVENSTTSVANITPVSTITAWEGKFTRIRVTRNGNMINFNASDWNSTSPGTDYSIDLSTDSRFAVFLSSASIGFYTHSQAQSRFYDVVAPGLSGGSVFSVATGKIWDSVSGNWQLQGSNLSFSSKLGNYKYVTNPQTNSNYHVFRKFQRKA